MLNRRKLLLATALFTLVALSLFTRDVRPAATWLDPVILTIDGVVPKPQKLTAAEFGKLPRRAVPIKNADGSVTRYEGPLLSDVLATAGVVFGPDLKGKALANFVLVTGADKFRVVFALPELDASFTDRFIILADKRDGQLLTASEGPLRSIVVPEADHLSKEDRSLSLGWGT